MRKFIRSIILTGFIGVSGLFSTRYFIRDPLIFAQAQTHKSSDSSYNDLCLYDTVITMQDLNEVLSRELFDSILSGKPIINALNTASDIYIRDPFYDQSGLSEKQGSGTQVFVPVYADYKLAAAAVITKYQGTTSITLREVADMETSIVFQRHAAADYASNTYIPLTSEANKLRVNADIVAYGNNEKDQSSLYNITHLLEMPPTDMQYDTSYPAVKILTYQVKRIISGKPNSIWAAASTSIIYHERPSQYTNLLVADVINRMNVGDNTFLPVTAIPNVLSQYLPHPWLPTVIYSPLSFDQIKVVINNNDPAYMGCVTLRGAYPGAATLYGYRDISGGLTLYVGDSYTGTKFTVTASGYNNVTMFMNDNTYLWDTTVRLLYSN